jgi:WD40 repeat protein
MMIVSNLGNLKNQWMTGSVIRHT